MSTIELLSDLRRRNITLSVNEGKLRCQAPKGVLTPDLQNEIAQHKAELLLLLQATQSKTSSQVPPIETIVRGRSLPLSFAQQRLWFLDKLDPGTTAYNVSGAIKIEGQFDLDIFERSITEIVRRHEVLRTTFQLVVDKPVQVIASHSSVKIPFVDLSTLPEVAQMAEVKRVAQVETNQAFDLSKGPLFRVMLLQLNATTLVWLYTIHHIIFDGWSAGVLLRELTIIYTAFSSGKPSPLPELNIQYADYAAWQRNYLKGEVFAEHLKYWQQQLSEMPPLLEFPHEYRRPALQTFRGDRRALTLTKELSQSLLRFSQAHGVTLYMLLLAAVKTLLYRYTNQTDIIIGTNVANRNLPQIEALIGYFVNQVVLRTNLDGHPTFVELLERVKMTTVEAYKYQELPFEKLVEAVQPERTLSYHPLFQIVFDLANFPQSDLELPGAHLTQLEIERRVTKLDLVFVVREYNECLAISIEYNMDMFGGAIIERMLTHFQCLLESILATPLQKIEAMPILSAAERHRVVVNFNDTHQNLPLERPYSHLFEEQVDLQPDAIAAVYNEQQVTYQWLNQRSNQMAHWLRQQGFEQHSCLGMVSERSIDVLVTLLAILKAGYVYVPLDPTYPDGRLIAIMQDCHLPLVITQSMWIDRMVEITHNLSPTPSIYCWEESSRTTIFTYGNAVANQQITNLQRKVDLHEVCQVFYTSGSTGVPKGVMVEHIGMLNHLWGKSRFLKLTSQSILAHTAPHSFDIAIWQYLAALMVGGKIVIYRDDIALNPLRFLHAIDRDQITVVQTVPTLLNHLLQAYKSLSRDNEGVTLQSLVHMASNAEKLPVSTCRLWHELLPSILLSNMYGATETSDDVAHCLIQKAPDKDDLRVPVGSPISGFQFYILDQQFDHVPLGCIGQIAIAGVGVSQGYMNDPQKTAKVFVPNPFADVPGSRLYLTGDRGRWTDVGLLDVLGRIDKQVKVHGRRIELGEIETTLTRHAAVTQAVALIRDDMAGNSTIVAYVTVSANDCDQSNIENNNGRQQIDLSNESIEMLLRKYLMELLPRYMIPSAIIIMPAMPLNTNGKVDRKLLPLPIIHTSMEPTHKYIAPRDEIEKNLTDIWQNILQVQPIGISDSFFALGGHSLLAITLITEIQQQLQQDVPLSALYENDTIEHLRNFFQAKCDSFESCVIKIQSGDSRKPLFCIHPGSGFVDSYINLAQYLAPTQPVYGLQSVGLNKMFAPQTQVEEMASHYIEAILSLQEQGPYLLAGWSFGGLVAFEIAQQLQARGHFVDLLVLIDSAVKYGYHYDDYDDATLLVDFFAQENLGLSVEHLRSLEYEERLRYVMMQAKAHNLLPSSFTLDQAHRVLQVYKANGLAESNYQVSNYPGALTLIRAEDPLDSSPHHISGWADVAQEGTEIYMVPGTTHYNLLAEPHIQLVARFIQNCIDRGKLLTEVVG